MIRHKGINRGARPSTPESQEQALAVTQADSWSPHFSAAGNLIALWEGNQVIFSSTNIFKWRSLILQRELQREWGHSILRKPSHSIQYICSIYLTWVDKDPRLSVKEWANIQTQSLILKISWKQEADILIQKVWSTEKVLESRQCVNYPFKEQLSFLPLYT